MQSKENEKAVSPIISVLLLIGLTVGLVAILSQIAFSTLSTSETPSAELSFSHIESNPSGDAVVSIRMVRSQNVESLEYTVESRSGTQKDSGQLSELENPGDSQDINMRVTDSLVVTGESEGGIRRVLSTYYVPD